MNSEFSNKLLLVLDRQSVHSPTFSGVFSDVLDLPAEGSARLAVIRGPEETTWGGKAVDGVTNVIGKKASETHRAPVAVGASNFTQGFRATQFGGNADKSTDYRIFAQHFQPSHLPGLPAKWG